MKKLTAGHVRSHFLKILVQVKNGERVEVLNSKSHEPMAMIVPLTSAYNPRKIGILDGKAVFETRGNGKITDTEFLGL
jgi:antitoxin (DNA-binding transcriptional repressor) of toxin-antitoxin stability system